MNEDDEKPIAYDAYEQMADAYAELIDTKDYNAYIERPTTLSLLPDVKGLRVLDAGCGPGVYSEWLIQHGASVVALDSSPKMVELARQRLGDAVDVYLANLDRPLTFLDDDSFDLVLSPLVPDYILDWRHLLGEFARVLKENGVLVFSVEHPFTKFNLGGTDNYFLTERLVITWRGFGEAVDVPTIRRPLTAMTKAIVETGFIIENIVEAFPSKKLRETDPETYEKTSKFPTFLCFRARRDSQHTK
ncbi:MAG: class I SAM-dependent methyltransferase [Candidatus Thorarchaeota archaeon]